ncbi:uncharacterized protein LOC108735619 [Agrilus planipennis]|uniref:Uncharacterized protein LOC108735619 n=1 Tax=Agrilus planipennis TaxID=224129 RepID=A0A7F5QZM6_AGRPL|nr:uncharacterized protein LOC108735619 [Agrilus planipennis]
MFRLAILLHFVLLFAENDAKMALKSGEFDVYSKYMKIIYEKHLNPQDITFCMDCHHRLTDYIPKEIPLIMINSKSKQLQWYQNIKIDSYILDISTETENVLDLLEEMPGWNPRAKFFIMFEGGSVSHLLKQLFAKYITNVVILTPVNISTLKVLTYFPYKNGQLRPKSIKSTTIAIFGDEYLNDTVDLFPDKIPRKWKNATINVMPVYAPPYMMCPTCPSMRGLEFLLLDNVGRCLGIKFKYPNNVSNAWGRKTINGSYTLGMGAVQERKFDLAVGGYHANSPDNVDFDMIYPHMEDNVVVVVHSANVEARWKSTIDIFQFRELSEIFKFIMYLDVTSFDKLNLSQFD